jgi:excisionase family DNA binding protein
VTPRVVGAVALFEVMTMSARNADSTLDGTAEVLTLAEAAAYLRVGEEVLRQMVSEQALPARKVGGEWRFLRSALRDWLRQDSAPGERFLHLLAAIEQRFAEIEGRLLAKTGSGDTTVKHGSRQRLLRLAGVWKDDPTLEQMLEEIYQARRRPVSGEDK